MRAARGCCRGTQPARASPAACSGGWRASSRSTREAIDDGVTMVSELAANTLHANQQQLLPANPELWLYLRGTGQRAELVCKVFDTLPGWVRGNVPGRTVVPGAGRRDERPRPRGGARAVGRALGTPPHQVPAVRAPGSAARRSGSRCRCPPSPPGSAGGPRPPPRDAMTELEKDLSTRGFGGRLVRADDHAADMAVLSIAGGLTVWCRSAAAWLRAPGVPAQQWSYCDLVEVGEQAVQAHEASVATRRLLSAGRRQQDRALTGTGRTAAVPSCLQAGSRPRLAPRLRPPLRSSSLGALSPQACRAAQCGALIPARPGAWRRRRAPLPRSGRRRSR